MLVSDKPIKINKRYLFKMNLPETIAGSREVEFEAESRWCQNDVNQDFYDTGFELIDPTNKFLEALDKLVHDCLFKE